MYKLGFGGPQPPYMNYYVDEIRIYNNYVLD